MADEKIINYKEINYIVSTDGHIFSTGSRKMKYHQEIKQYLNPDGYSVVTVGSTNKRVCGRVGRMVALAFISNPDNLPEIHHIDGDRTNNDVSNLVWISHEDNIREIPFEVGSAARSGENNGRSTVTTVQVREIRHLYENQNQTISQIARQYAMPYSTVFNIVKYNTWKNI